MALKTLFCPNCNCVLPLPQFDDEAMVVCVACKIPITLAMKAGKLTATTAPIKDT